MNMLKVASVVVAVSILGVAAASAIDYGANITIADGITAGGNVWWSNAGEDQEVEPNCLTGQGWDLEGFFLSGSTLTLVGGYDHVNGYGVNPHWYAGDIFIDVNGDAEYGPGNSGSGHNNSIVANSFGYDYVLDLDFSTLQYSVYQINNQSLVQTVWYQQNDESNPWRYSSGGTLLSGYENLSIGYTAGLTDGDVGFAGGSHNAVQVDLSFLAGTDFTAHYTYQCGNDNIMGHARVPDAASTLILLGSALLGVEGLRRKWARR